MEEVGELARLMARRFGEQSTKPGEGHVSLSDELADILWVLLCLANQMGVDMEKAFLENIQKKTTRDRLRHLVNEKLKPQ